MQRLRLASYLAPRDICHIAVGMIAESEAPSLHGHDFMEIFLVVSGEGRHWINGRKAGLHPGDLVLIRRLDRHGFTSVPDHPLRLLNVAFPGAWFAHFRALLVAAPVSRWLAGRMPPSVRLAAAARQTLEHRGLDLMMARGPRHLGLAHFCLEALGFLGSRADSDPQPPPDWLSGCIGAMDCPEDLRETIAHFQRRAGRSAEHFARECRRCYGAAPTEMLNRARVRHAKRRLLEGNAKVIDVALDCGFHNLGYFHRTFLRLAGCTPRHWRMRNAALTVPR